MSLFKSKILGATSDLTSKLESVESENTDLRAEIESMKQATIANGETLVALTDEKNTLTADLEAANTLLAETQASLAELQAKLETAETATQDFDAKVAEKARLLMLEMGHEPVTETDPQPTDVVATFKGLKGQEALDFYRANKKAIQKALSNA